ncbi:hypothetical protein ACO1O0_007272 [Amphichorda felina]
MAPIVPTTEPPSSPTQNFDTQSPTGTSTVPPAVFTSNLAYARSKNEEFKTLSPGAPCDEPAAPACIEGDDYRCTDAGTLELNERCPSGMGCYAVPWPYASVVRIGCIAEDEAKKLLQTDTGGGDDGSDGSGDGNGNAGNGGDDESGPAPSLSAPPTPEPELVTTTTRTSTTVITRTAEKPRPTTIPEEAPAPEPTNLNNPPPQAQDPSPPTPATPSTTKKPSPSPSSQPTAGTTLTDAINNPSPSDMPLIITLIDEPASISAFPGFAPHNDKPQAEDKEGGSNRPPTTTSDQPVPNSKATVIFDGTPTVSFYFTITTTVTEKERETVTLIVPN